MRSDVIPKKAGVLICFIFGFVFAGFLRFPKWLESKFKNFNLKHFSLFGLGGTYIPFWKSHLTYIPGVNFYRPQLHKHLSFCSQERKQTPHPLVRHPRADTTPPTSGQTAPPYADTLQGDGHCSGRYAPYWNAFLLTFVPVERKDNKVKWTRYFRRVTFLLAVCNASSKPICRMEFKSKFSIVQDTLSSVLARHIGATKPSSGHVFEWHIRFISLFHSFGGSWNCFGTGWRTGSQLKSFWSWPEDSSMDRYW